MRKFLLNTTVLGALFGGVSVVRATVKGPRDWRTWLMWAGWGISLAVAIGTVVKEAQEIELEDEGYTF
jgi:hypothetical protein